MGFSCKNGASSYDMGPSRITVSCRCAAWPSGWTITRAGRQHALQEPGDVNRYGTQPRGMALPRYELPCSPASRAEQGRVPYGRQPLAGPLQYYARRLGGRLSNCARTRPEGVVVRQVRHVKRGQRSPRTDFRRSLRVPLKRSWVLLLECRLRMPASFCGWFRRACRPAGRCRARRRIRAGRRW